ncbi:hypothetical protein N658DRAFT_320947 [Parathielavia hyrcaniae]|uniref:Uncharacterized protein n=1 Tax=Parathielavia hyrcaniae TaxID=113614 RepID=A0AAN6T2T1_9PEZI|nr:hypothetical protein N658DRAFT_320947 [Parathielavia hyrcaniae]
MEARIVLYSTVGHLRPITSMDSLVRPGSCRSSATHVRHHLSELNSMAAEPLRSYDRTKYSQANGLVNHGPRSPLLRNKSASITEKQTRWPNRRRLNRQSELSSEIPHPATSGTVPCSGYGLTRLSIVDLGMQVFAECYHDKVLHRSPCVQERHKCTLATRALQVLPSSFCNLIPASGFPHHPDGRSAGMQAPFQVPVGFDNSSGLRIT